MAKVTVHLRTDLDYIWWNADRDFSVLRPNVVLVHVLAFSSDLF